MLDVTMVGCGTVGHGVIDALRGADDVRITQLVVGASQVDATRREFPGMAVAASVDALPEHPGVLLECASRAAVNEHVLPALRNGIDCMLCTISAFAERGFAEAVDAATRAGGSRLHLLSGAVGGIDAIAAARVGGLTKVTHTGTKPPRGWKGTPAAEKFDLDRMTERTVLFEGSARDAARLYPNNANVAATISMVGIGLDHTRVQLVADPAATHNTHHIRAEGSFGEMELKFTGFPLPGNPKTSALTVYSAVSALRRRTAAVTF